MQSPFNKFCALLLLAFSVTVLIAPSKDTLVDEMTTPERVDKYPWWPTKLSTTAETNKYIGGAICADCHKDIATSQRESEMAQTLMPAAKSEYLSAAVGTTLKVDGFDYLIKETPLGPQFTLQSTATQVSKTLVWAFGSGKISQVYMTPEADIYNESHFSYFDSIHGFDSTPAQPVLRVTGQNEGQENTAKKAIGRQVQMHEVRRCFACHAANVPADGPITGIFSGVTCETCHGPGSAHVAAERAGLRHGGSLVLNPARLRPVDRVDFCGSCHATSMDVQMSGAFGLASVRFPAYRLENSKCWRDDPRIQCTACHDPHQPLQRDFAAYDQRCLACHVSGTNTQPDATHPGPACKVATNNCASCHMPKYEFPDVHHKFTDHDIRVVRQGEPIPG